MERRTCKLCFKSFSNGRALGGHMRSHMAALQPPPAPAPAPAPEQPPPPPPPRHTIESASSSSTSSSSSEEEMKAEMLQSYGLRENPKKSFRLVDPEFSFVDAAGSVVVQDRESETESNSKNPSRRRSKRTRKSGAVPPPLFLHHHHHHQLRHQQSEQEEEQQHEEKKKKPKLVGIHKGDLIVEAEPVSSVSDTTPEEDVARCLMMLSRGVWARKSELDTPIDETDDDDEEEEEDEEDGGGGEIKLGGGNKSKAKYQCGTCKKVFRSYQALGGHRASHKKIRCTVSSSSTVVAQAHRDTRQVENQNPGNADMGREDRRVHECPVCFRVFGSGQALGGHKRSHLSASATTTIISLTTHRANNLTKFADNLIDLNLPAPIEDDDASQIELSAVSDAEFVDPIK
ncbi:hypothetical protein Sjap_020244 [Stephania japonica]|uniref:C2H2-type domain-containing protein n=1 Tax=Stephania japonica TaxID=461633 RepID=A0AAP0I0A4_9MAGN